MIYVSLGGIKIPCEDNGTPIDPPSYWGESILADIAAAYARGDWEQLTVDNTPQPQWTAFNTAMLTDPYWQSWSIPHDLRVAIISSAIGANADAFQTAYDLGASIVPPSTEAINDWQTMADTFSIPVTFNPF